MDNCYCDLYDDHILNNPKVLPCGFSACYACLQKCIDKNGNLNCVCCKQSHLIPDPDKLISNVKIANMIKNNLKVFTSELTDRLQLTIESVQSTYSNGEAIINNYYEFLKDEVKLKLDSLKSELDTLGEQLNVVLDEKCRSSIGDLEKFGSKVQENTHISQTLVDSLRTILVKSDNCSQLVVDENMYVCQDNLNSLKRFEQEFSKIFNKIKFKPNEFSLKASLIGELVDDTDDDNPQSASTDISQLNQSTSQIFVADSQPASSNNRVATSMPEPRIIDMAENKRMEWPCGLCNVNGKELIVTDNVNNEIVLLNSDFEITKTIKNVSDVQFTSPFGICTDDKDSYFVCDGANHRVLILNRSFNRIKKIIGKKGKANGEFQFPLGICFYSGYLYVTDHDNRRIQIFTCNGEFFKEVKLVTSALKRNMFVKDQDLIYSPWCLSVTDDTIAVLDFCESIYIYNFDGQLRSVVQDSMINSILIVDRCLYLHSNNGTFTCYERNKGKHDQHQYHLSYKHTFDCLKAYSAFMVYFNDQVIISFGEKKFLAAVKPSAK